MGDVEELFSCLERMYSLVDRVENDDARVRLELAIAAYIKNYVLEG